MQNKKNKHQYAMALLQKEVTSVTCDNVSVYQFKIKLAFHYHGAFQGKETYKKFIYNGPKF